MGSDRWLIVGLGNPGPTYSHNRHNVGYWTVNRLARLHGIPLKARRLAAVGEGHIGDSDVTLVKPRTFVNDSGHAVAAARKHTRVGPENVLVVCVDHLHKAHLLSIYGDFLRSTQEDQNNTQGVQYAKNTACM